MSDRSYEDDLALPDLVVFDLDFTLWDCDGTWCDCLTPPFVKEDGKVMDGDGRLVRLYDDVGGILDRCDQNSVPMALASRTEQPTWADELIELLGIGVRFRWTEIYPASKLEHFAALYEGSGVDYERMLFFDDEMRNISEVSKLGVTSVHVKSGVSDAVFSKGLRQFRKSAE